MTKISSAMLADMHARRLSGESCDDIGRSYGIKGMTVYQRLRRKYGLEVYSGVSRAAANDNSPAGRVVRMSAHNGGCSTLSGLVPVSLVRVPSIDGVAA